MKIKISILSIFSILLLPFHLSVCGTYSVGDDDTIETDDTPQDDDDNDSTTEEANWSWGEGGEAGDFLFTEPETGTTYYIHAPDSYDHSFGTPLLLFCHGDSFGGTFENGIYSDPSNTEWVSTSDEYGFIFIAPFVTENGERHSWSFYEFDTLDMIFIDTERYYNIDLDRIYIAGHSAGAFMTVYYTLYHDDNPLAGAGSVAGGLKPLYGDYPEDEPPYKTPFFVVHSPDDIVVNFEYSEALVEALEEHGHEYEFVTEFNDGSSGHIWDSSLNQMMWEFFAEHPRS